jgi:transcriptional regulator with XRE-family HTH domain
VNIVSVKRDLLDSLKTDREYRHAWNLENVYTGVCFQIRALREQRELSQAGLGKSARMAQERMSILEDPNADTKPTLRTLLRIADACDVGLDVRFVPYGTVIDRSTKTNLQTLEVPSFDEELPDLERGIEREEQAVEAARSSHDAQGKSALLSLQAHNEAPQGESLSFIARSVIENQAGLRAVPNPIVSRQENEGPCGNRKRKERSTKSKGIHGRRRKQVRTEPEIQPTIAATGSGTPSGAPTVRVAA